MVWSRGGDVVAVNSWQSRFGIVLIVVLGGNKHENDPEAGSPNTYSNSPSLALVNAYGCSNLYLVAGHGQPPNACNSAGDGQGSRRSMAPIAIWVDPAKRGAQRVLAMNLFGMVGTRSTASQSIA